MQGFTRPFTMEENGINAAMDLYIQANTPKGKTAGKVERSYMPEKEDTNRQHFGIKVEKSIALDYFTKLGYTDLEGL